MSNNGRGTVIVTGSSTGIGASCARYLADRGFRVFAGVRKEGDAANIRAYGNARLQPLTIDITKHETIVDALKVVTTSFGSDGLTALVNNAGVSYDQPIECVPLDSLRHQFEVNVIGTVAMTQACVPLLRQSRGRIVTVGSINGRVATAWSGPYCMSKFALEAFSDCLRQELKPWGINVSLIEPGAIKTALWNKGLGFDWSATASPKSLELYGDSFKRFRRFLEKSAATAVAPDKVNEAVLHAITATTPHTRYLVGSDAKAFAFIASLLPDRMLDRLIQKTLFGA